MQKEKKSRFYKIRANAKYISKNHAHKTRFVTKFLPRRKAMNIVCPLDVTLDLTERLKFVDLFIHKLIMNM